MESLIDRSQLGQLTFNLSTSHEMRMKRGAPDPEIRVGNCCGCNMFPVTLYKIMGIYRYRCAPCFEKETGCWPHLAPTKEDYARQQSECDKLKDRNE